MTKRLQTVGNSSGIIIDKPVLVLLRISAETELDISTDVERLIVTPIRSDQDPQRELARAQKRTLKLMSEPSASWRSDDLVALHRLGEVTTSLLFIDLAK